MIQFWQLVPNRKLNAASGFFLNFLTQKTVLSIFFRTVSEYFAVLFQEDAAEQRGEGEGEPGLGRGDV
jgi:hypothetical protein